MAFGILTWILGLLVASSPAYADPPAKRPPAKAGAAPAKRKALAILPAYGAITGDVRREIDRSIREGIDRVEHVDGALHPLPSLEEKAEANGPEGWAATMERLERDRPHIRDALAQLMGKIAHDKPTHYLRVHAERSLERVLRVTLSLYDLESPSLSTPRRKVVGVCGESEKEVLRRIASAAECFSRPCQGTPYLRVKGTPPREGVEVGAEVALDACSSHDPDGDELRPEWHQFGTGDTKEPLAKVYGWELQFTPTTQGVHRVQLVVFKGSSKFELPEIKIPAYHRPIVDPGDSRNLTWPGDKIALSGARSENYNRAVWRQTAGPMVKLRADEQGRCEESPWSPCEGMPPAPGLYTFELELWNGPLSARRSVSYLVAARPQIEFTFCEPQSGGRPRGGPPEAGCGQPRCVLPAWPNYAVMLRAQVRPDEIDDKPIISWRFADRGPDNQNAMLEDPFSPTPTFVANDVGTYDLKVTALVRRDFEGRKLQDTHAECQRIEVKRPTMLFSEVPLFNFPIHASYIDPKTRKSTPSAPFITPIVAGFEHATVNWLRDSLRFNLRLALHFGRLSLATGAADRWNWDVGVLAALGISYHAPRFELGTYAGGYLGGADFARLVGGPDTGVQLTAPFGRFAVVVRGGWRLIVDPDAGGDREDANVRRGYYNMVYAGIGFGARAK